MINIETTSYNERRMGKPWIAKVDFADPKGTFEFGDWSGDARNGGAGILTIDAKAGDIVATGQKDNRQPRNSAATFLVVTPAGELADLGDKGAAYKHYLAAKSATPDKVALKAEKAVLLARLAVIDEMINA